MDHFLEPIRASLGVLPVLGDWGSVLELPGQSLPSVFAVSDLASASVAAATAEVSALAADTAGGVSAHVEVDRRLASIWFAGSIVPEGWRLAPAWNALAGDYETADGWIKLHTNAPHHLAAALGVLGVDADRGAVAKAVAGWTGDELESAVVQAGGAAAVLRSIADWQVHPNGVAVGSESLISLESKGLARSPEHDVEVEVLSRTEPWPRTEPLAGVRVLDLTRVLAGPVATRFLAGWGAEVLRIDPKDWSEDGVVPEVTLGKRCAHLDLKSPEGSATLLELLEQADVIVHGYRPGAVDGLGIGAELRHELRPGLVDVALDAFGWTGTWRDRRGFDSLVQMSSGIAHEGMVVSGSQRPEPLPVQALDHATGYLMAAAAVRGLRHRLATGRGTTAKLSLARTAALLIDGPAGDLDQPFDPVAPDEIGDFVESTAWGPARRVRPPMSIAGAEPTWRLPATTLGAHPAAWA